MTKVPKVLIVDDDNDFIELITAKLESYKFEIISTTNTDQVLDLIKKNVPDVILLDVDMPKADGFTVAKRISENADTKDTKVIFFTTLGENSPIALANNKRLSKEFGAVDYLKKSIDLDILANHIEDLSQN